MKPTRELIIVEMLEEYNHLLELGEIKYSKVTTKTGMDWIIHLTGKQIAEIIRRAQIKAIQDLMEAKNEVSR